MIVGNHETNRSTLEYNTANMLYNNDNFEIINEPATYAYKDVCLSFLPYILEDKRGKISDYIQNPYESYKHIIFSHNDIKDFQMGKFISTEGFSIEDIEKNCDLYFNGHLHNCGNVTDKIINVGNLTGQNFSEDAFKYEHRIIILDTDTLNYKSVPNPFALNFYKIDYNGRESFDGIRSMAVCSVSCFEKDLQTVKDELNKMSLTESRIHIKPVVNTEMTLEDTFSVNHFEMFCEYMKSIYGDNKILDEELGEICK